MLGLLLMAAALTVRPEVILTDDEMRQAAATAQNYLDQAETIVDRLNKQPNVDCYIWRKRDESGNGWVGSSDGFRTFTQRSKDLMAVCSKSYKLK